MTEEFYEASRQEESLQEELTLALDIEDPIERAETLIDLAPDLPPKGTEYALSSARSAVEDIEDPEVKVKLLMNLARHEPDEAYREDTLQYALSIAESTEDMRVIGDALGEWAQASLQAGDLERARNSAEQALEIAEATENMQLRKLMLDMIERIHAQELQSGVAGGERLRDQDVSGNVRLPDGTEAPRRQPPEIAARALADGWSKQDYLRFSDYANALADLIEDKKLETPLTISIDAPWGMGKTTLMRMIKSRLEGQDRSREARLASESFPTVWFNAWRHDKEESLWAALILEILAQVRPQLDWQRRAGLWWTLNKERFRFLLWSFLKALLVVLGVLAVVLVVIAVLWTVGVDLEAAWEYITVLGGLGVLLAVYMLGKDTLTFFYKKVTNPFKLGVTKFISSKPNYEERVGFLDRFRNDFECVVQRVTGDDKKKLVIFIDDLDRSAPPKTAEVIEAISMLLDSERCVFVLGMDSQMVANSIEVKYKDLQENLAGRSRDEPALGRRFLEKIVQIPFAIPRTSPKAFEEFIRYNLEVGRQTQEVPAEEVLEAERLIEQEQERGKSLDEAAESVQANSDTSLVGEAVAEAKVEIRARSFLRDSEEVERAVTHAAPYLGYNPRKVKRFINLFKLQALIANRRRLLDQGTIELDHLSKWLLISTHWPGVIEAAATDQDFVERILQAREAHDYSLKPVLTEAQRQEARSELESLTADFRIERFYKYDELIQLLSELHNSGAESSHYLSLTEVTTGSS